MEITEERIIGLKNRLIEILTEEERHENWKKKKQKCLRDPRHNIKSSKYRVTEGRERT